MGNSQPKHNEIVIQIENGVVDLDNSRVKLPFLVIEGEIIGQIHVNIVQPFVPKAISLSLEGIDELGKEEPRRTG